MREIETLLEEFRSNLPGVSLVAVFTKYGEYIASISPQSSDITIINNILAIIQRFVDEIDFEEEYERTVFEGKDEVITIKPFAKKMYIAAIASNSVIKLGLLWLDLDKTVKKIENIIMAEG